MMETARNVGTIEVLKPRIYALDANLDDHPAATTVVVDRGVYPLYEDNGVYYWMRQGRINEIFKKFGDGMFTVANGDRPTGPMVRFPSRVYGPEQWAEFLTDPVITEGHAEQRLRLTIYSECDCAACAGDRQGKEKVDHA